MCWAGVFINLLPANVPFLDAFFISSTFMSNTRLKFAKNQAKAMQHSQAELLHLENYPLFYPRYDQK